MAKIRFIDNPSNYEYVTNKLIRCKKNTIIEDIEKYQSTVPNTYLYLRSIDFVRGSGIFNDEYEVHIEVYKPKQPCTCLEEEVLRLQNQLQQAQQRLENYKQSIVFIPVEKEPFWFLDSSGNPISESYTNSCDKPKVDFGNCFRCLEEAVVSSKFIYITRKLKSIARELNQGSTIDWNNSKQKKYYICLDTSKKDSVLKLNEAFTVKSTGTVYCLNNKFLEVCIERLSQQSLMDYLKWN